MGSIPVDCMTHITGYTYTIQNKELLVEIRDREKKKKYLELFLRMSVEINMNSLVYNDDYECYDEYYCLLCNLYDIIVGNNYMGDNALDQVQPRRFLSSYREYKKFDGICEILNGWNQHYIRSPSGKRKILQKIWDLLDLDDIKKLNIVMEDFALWKFYSVNETEYPKYRWLYYDDDCIFIRECYLPMLSFYGFIYKIYEE